MYKLIIFPLIIVFMMMMYAYQLDQELAMQTLFRSKYAVNRAAHAAAQQTNTMLSRIGIMAIDADRASEMAALYLQRNLELDSSFEPLPSSFFSTKIDVLEFVVVNDEVFPYHYENETYDYSVIMDRPGVILIISVAYPRLFNVIEPIEWKVKGAAEMVY